MSDDPDKPAKKPVANQWEKGHPYFPSKDPTLSAAQMGPRTADTRKRMRNLAMVIRENWPPEQVFHWLREVAAGRDPDAKVDSLGAATFVPIEWGTRVRAVKMLLERMLGMPAQHVHMEAEIKALAIVANVPVEQKAVAKLSNEELEQLRELGRKMLGKSAATAAPAPGPVLDVASVTREIKREDAE